MSFLAGDTWRASVRSRDRGLLALLLFTDVDPDDAPTRIRIGSHVDAARALAPFGDDGLDNAASAPLVEQASAHRPVTLATGTAGDVYLCHCASSPSPARPCWSRSPSPTGAVVVVLDRGRVVEVGSHAELMAARGHYAELYQLQAKGYR
ncbi:ABC transporter ATP-binding protein/permease [Thermasporomyces composti]|uniref:ABC transporter ATP-binding protein/permease n=1 Tax=Thermasporomyces composti TaxID=696763 RepID=UPI000E24AA95|nr:ABC transporter ATP-binding protein/permease [Thermasporomyces composti]